MFPVSATDGMDQDAARPSAWITKAKLAVQGDKKVQPFVFQAVVSRIALKGIPAADSNSRVV